MTSPRHEYTKGALEESNLAHDPIAQLDRWLADARESGAIDPTAMALATVDAKGKPSCRIVLLRGLDAQGLTFFTNYLSHKGKALATHPYAATTFWWGSLERQVRVEGRVERVSAEESDAYFASRPLESRYASAASPQSSVVESRATLEASVESLRQRFPEGPPRPEGWGGYRLLPDRIEFWQGRPARLHDRILYEREGEGWLRCRLAP
ncbi:pyridoxamine 5'-phosphate oxidase [soil metagenome]